MYPRHVAAEVDASKSHLEGEIVIRKQTFTLAVVLCGFVTQSPAAIVEVLRYRLGEPGTFSVDAPFVPIDTVGGRNMTDAFGPFTPGGVTVTMNQAYSTNATAFGLAGVSGAYGADSDGLPVDNFAVEIWARTADVNQPFQSFFSLNADAAGSLMFHIGNGTWSASYSGVAWVGPVSGAGPPVSPDAWTNLAVIRSNGISTFYLNGVAQSGTTLADPTTGAAFGIHLAVTPGGLTNFVGDLDEARIFTFDPLVDDPVAALSVNVVPEPTSVGLLAVAMSGIAFLLRRRRSLA